MTLNDQSTFLAAFAVGAVVVVVTIMGFSANEIRRQTEEISMAENTAKGVNDFRYLIMETALYREQRSLEQWRQGVASFQYILATDRYAEPGENALLAREKADLTVATRLFARLGKADTVSLLAPDATPAALALTASIVSALFLTTQDMADDAFELVRLNRLDLEASEQRAGLLMLLSLVVLTLLTVTANDVIRRQVLAPVAALEKVIAQVTRGDLTVRSNLAIANEIGVMAASFDLMTYQLEQTHDALKSENAGRRHVQQAMEETLHLLAGKSRELSHAQKNLQTTIDHVPALVAYWDSALLNQFANRAFLRWLGISPHQMQGKHFREIVGTDRFQEVEAHLRGALQGSAQIFEDVIRYPSGRRRAALFSYRPDIEGGVVKGFYSFVSDVTPLKKAQAAQAGALAHLQGLVDAAVDFAIIATDADGLIKLFSKGAERMLGYAAADLVDISTLLVLPSADEISAQGNALSATLGRPVQGFDVLVEAARRNGSDSREWQYVRKDGTTVPVNMTVTPLRDRDGVITGFLGIGKNIQAEKDILQALAATRDEAESANAAKSVFLANISHEIRTPMNAILGMLQLLQHTGLTMAQLDYVIKTQSAAQSLLGLLNDILDFSKMEADKMTLEDAPFRIETMMRNLSVILAANAGTKDLEVLFAIDPQLPARLHGDVLRLQQIVLNLAGNAIKFTGQGEVIVSVRVVAADQQCTTLEFAVQDSGIGIAPDKLSTIFEGFSQAEVSTARRFGGTGLGLTISRRLVALMGGTLMVESTPGVGSRFWFTVTFRNAPDADAARVATSHGVLARYHALIVDGNASARKILLTMVESLGWSGVTAAGGDEALALLQQGEASECPFDLVLMDWRMRRMDGWALTRRIRQLQQGGKAPIVIMMTALGHMTLATGRARRLLNGFLIKPITASMLFDAVVNASASHGNEAGSETALPHSWRLQGLRLLVVDDNLLNRQVAQELLLSQGATVEVVASGGAAAQRALTADPPFDAVLMDVQMPELDGYDTTRKIRQDPRMQALPIIAMTANATATDKRACLAAGMNDHIGKPVHVDTLVNTVLRYCVQQPPPADLEPALPVPPALACPPAGSLIERDRALQRLGGNRSLYMNLARRFAADAVPMVADARIGLRNGRHADVAALLHAFKSMAATVGAAELAGHAAGFETRLRSGDVSLPVMSGAISTLERLTRQSLDDLEVVENQLLAAVASPAPDPDDSGPVRFGTLLDELDTLLNGANMRAVSVFAELERNYRAALGERLTPLAASISRLDFRRALADSRQLRGRLP